jgi:predicted nucleic acid-binding protein
LIHLDTSVLIDALTGPARLGPELRDVVRQGERVLVSTLVLYEWWRGPRTDRERHVQALLFPEEAAITFDTAVASRSAALARAVKRPRGREIDLAIAACALEHNALLWTLNPEDFRDVPGLTLYGGRVPNWSG